MPTSFFETYIPYWEMQPNHRLVQQEDAYCLVKTNEIYAVYLPKIKNSKIDLRNAEGSFDIHWYNPREGGQLVVGTITQVESGRIQNLGKPKNKKLASRLGLPFKTKRSLRISLFENYIDILSQHPRMCLKLNLYRLPLEAKKSP